MTGYLVRYLTSVILIHLFKVKTSLAYIPSYVPYLFKVHLASVFSYKDNSDNHIIDILKPKGHGTEIVWITLLPLCAY